MACGAPVVASSGGAIPEIAGGAAELCDPGDPQDIAETILRVLDDPALRRSLCERSLRRAKDFSWVDCARRTADVLRDAASGRVNRVVPVQPRSP
jgi:glycosyltransferase involved in cell wall biosynthesis